MVTMSNLQNPFIDMDLFAFFGYFKNYKFLVLLLSYYTSYIHPVVLLMCLIINASFIQVLSSPIFFLLNSAQNLKIGL